MALLLGNEVQIFPWVNEKALFLIFEDKHKYRHDKGCSFCLGYSTVKYLLKGDSTGEIIAPKRIYMRKNPNPNPPEVVEDPENILRSSNKNDKGIFHLQRSLSLPVEGIKSIDDVIFDKKFEQTLFISKSSSDLSQVIFDPERLISSKFAQQPSQPSSVSVFS